MFYRRKIVLALLQLFDGELEKIRLQKLLFLFTKSQQKAEYDFIPYKYGCYSYSANADLNAMARKNILIETDTHFKFTDKTNYITTLKDSDQKILSKVKTLYGKMSADGLMKHTYINYPFYAINSLRASSILTKPELEKIENSKPSFTQTILFTIGYEGISLEEYLVKLIRNDIKLLIDVRNNPLSMKFGFSKSQLKKYCESLNIQYLHFPELGIQSEERQELTTQLDYDFLFTTYRKNTLTKTQSTQIELLELLIKYKRIALTCFEANICQCHRKHLSEAIEKLPGFKYEVKHI
jgi:uncharacterized protein (DUF488 family)